MSKPSRQDATPTPSATNSTQICSSKSTRPDQPAATLSGNGTSGTTSSKTTTPPKTTMVISVSILNSPTSTSTNLGVTGWPYFTSVDYNPKFDQILISAHNFDEVWIIDHSTTTEEAASHEGGIYGHGGDLLYRWGNPQTYNRGDASDKKLYFQHQSGWIKPGLPGAGNILVFSNGVTRPGGPISSADEFTPDVDNDTGDILSSTWWNLWPC